MKRVLFGVICFLSIVFACRGKSLNQIQDLHRNIGKELVQVRRENPGLQSVMYTLLDQVGKLSRVATTVYNKQKKLKLALNEQKKVQFKVEDENQKLKDDALSLKKTIDDKAADIKKQVERLEQENSQLQQQNKELELERDQYLSKVRDLDDNLDKKVSNSTDSSKIKASKKLDQTLSVTVSK